MDPARYQRLRSLVHGAGALPAAERGAWLARAAGDDPALAREALALLAKEAEATGALLTPRGARDPGARFALPPGTRLGPYALAQELGRGGMGVVYAATGPDGAPLAVKVILPHLLTAPDARERFLREARLGLRIVHANVVRTLDVGEAAAGGATLLYLAMERVAGRTLRHVLDDLGPLPEALVREVALEAARGLVALHDAGAVHRDVKPENLFLTDERRVRLMDLGVAKTAGAGPTLTVEGLFVGSPAYASPEQAAGRPVGPASDLYALGCVLYELLAGRPPFEAQEPLALLRAHADSIPVPLRERRPEVSPFLGALVASLLAKQPEQRPVSARALVEALEEGEAGRWWRAQPPPALAPAPLGPHRRRSLPLVGREAEAALLRRALAEAQAGRGGVLLLEGEPGVGKSRLVEELPAWIAALPPGPGAAPVLVLTSLAEASLDGGLGAALLRQGEADATPEALARRLDVPLAVAEAYAAHLARRPPADGVQPLSPTGVELLTARLARRLAESRPRVWVIEDLHAADAEQRRLATALARGADEAPLLLLLTTRPGLDAETRAALARLPAFTSLELGRLAPPAVEELLGRAVDDPALGQRLARVLGARLDGVPLFVLETVRHLERSGHLRRGADGAYEAGPDAGSAEVPRALVDLVEARLAALAPAERSLLELAAVAGAEFAPALLASARSRPLLEVLEDLGRIERRQGLVRSGPSRVRFDHPLVREVLYAGIPAALRAAWHDALADALATGVPGSALADEGVVRLAGHRLAGASPAAARPEVERALELLARAHRAQERHDLLARAVEVPGLFEGPAACDRRVQLSDLGLRLRRGAAARAAAEAALALARREGWRPQAADALQQLGWVALRAADYDAAGSCASAALALGEELDEDVRRSRALRLLAQVHWMRGEPDQARRAAEQALALSAWLPDPTHAAQARAVLGILLQEQGRLAEAEAHQRAALAILRVTGDRRNVCAMLGDLANTLVGAGRMREALALYAEAHAEGRAAGIVDGEGTLLLNQGELALRCGELERARALYASARELAREAGGLREEGYALHGLGVVAAWSGDEAQARRLLEAALTLRRRIGNQPALAETLLQLGVLDAEQGRAQQARQHLDEAAALAGAVRDQSAAALAQLWAALGAGGDPEAAQRAFLEASSALRSDAALEGRWLLWRLFGRREDLDIARALVAAQEQHVDPDSRAAFRRHVPYVRGVLAG